MLTDFTELNIKQRIFMSLTFSKTSSNSAFVQCLIRYCIIHAELNKRNVISIFPNIFRVYLIYLTEHIHAFIYEYPVQKFVLLLSLLE